MIKLPMSGRRGGDSALAELVACVRAMEKVHLSRWRAVKFYTDAMHVYDFIQRGKLPAPGLWTRRVAERGCDLLKEHPGWEIVKAERPWVGPAHRLALEALNVHEAGRLRQGTLERYLGLPMS